MEKKALIVSLSPNVGHLSHVEAYYKLFEEIGYKSTAYVSQSSVRFLQNNLDIVTEVLDIGAYDVILVYSPSKRNLKELWRIKLKRRCKLIFVYHEPLGTIKSYREAGESWWKVLKIFIKDKANWPLIMFSDHIILSSQTARINYEKGVYCRLNRNYTTISLIFSDEYNAELRKSNRRYFSYIGTIAVDHSYNEYLNFIKNVINNKDLCQLNFLIATSSTVMRDSDIDDMLSSGRLTVIDGKPLSNEEINNCYASSYVVWNAYGRTTQSGVLAKSFMFGTPVILLKKNLSEYTTDGKDVVAIDDNKSYEQISSAVESIVNNFKNFTTACRDRFLCTFHFQLHKETMKRILDMK